MSIGLFFFYRLKFSLRNDHENSEGVYYKSWLDCVVTVGRQSGCGNHKPLALFACTAEMGAVNPHVIIFEATESYVLF